MVQTLEKPRVIEERPTKPRRRWIPWLVGLAVVIAGAVALVIALGEEDTGYDVAELATVEFPTVAGLDPIESARFLLTPEQAATVEFPTVAGLDPIESARFLLTAE